MPCPEKNSLGQPCQAAPGKSGYCFWHDPGREKDRDAARLRGGFRRKVPKTTGETPPDISSIQDVLLWTNAVLKDEAAQENSHQRSRTIAALLRIALEGVQVGDFEKRLENLEALIHARQQPSPDTSLDGGDT